MSITKQLYHLQEIDQDIEAADQSLSQKTSLLGDRRALDQAQSRLASEQQRWDEFRSQQKAAELEVDDLAVKIAEAEKKLYGGTITSPKELSNLQQEINQFKNRNGHLESQALEIIDRVAAAAANVEKASGEFQQMEADWQRQQQQLSEEIAQLKGQLEQLHKQRQQLSREIEPQALGLYERIRRNKKPPVAKAEAGICQVCRISLSASELQRARAGNPVQCGSCGRIIFIS